MRKLVQVWWAVAVIVAVAISVTIPVTIPVTIISVAVAIAVMVAIPAAAVVVVPVAGPFTPFAVAAVDNFEIGAAAAIDPDAVAVVSPSAIEDAIGFATLADDEDAIAGINAAEIAVHMVGGAIDEAGRSRFPISANAEIRATPAINPYAALARTPGLALDASSLAALTNHADAETGIGWTPGSAHVIGRAVHRIGFAPAAESVVATAEIRVTAPIVIGVAAVIAIPVIAAEISISAMVAHDLGPSAIDAKKNELLIVAAVCRKNLEMLSIASRAVGQIQGLANTGDNLYLALAQIFYSPQLGLDTADGGERDGHSLMNVGLREI